MTTDIHFSSLFAFSLGREWKLSLAELMAIFGHESYRDHSETIAIFEIRGYSDEQIQKRFLTIGGSIRVMKVLTETDAKKFPTDVITAIKESAKTGGKNTFALGAYGLDYQLSNIGLRIKKTLQESGLSVRLVNTENKNIVSAVFKREKLGRTGMEYNIISLTEKEGEKIQRDISTFLTVTLACQDIDSYTRRDTGKSRDMIIGMMPPKLVQMMLNIVLENKSTRPAIYDPFCGLGTTLIEAANMGITRIYGSDLSKEMVTASQGSLESFIKEEKIWQGRIRTAGGTPSKDFSHFESDIYQLDARSIGKSAALREANLHVVSEGYLGEMMSPRDISLEKVQSERKKLASMYMDFFSGLHNADFRGNIVMSFPFWNIHGVYSYFTEIYDVIDRCGFSVSELLPRDMQLNTRKGSLLYRRENQTVGREIIKIVRK